MIHDDRLQPGYVVGAPQTIRERLQCLWWFLRYPAHVAIVYPPADADAILNSVKTQRRNLEISTRKAKQLKTALEGEQAPKEARRLATELLARRDQAQVIHQELVERKNELTK